MQSLLANMFETDFVMSQQIDFSFKIFNCSKRDFVYFGPVFYFVNFIMRLNNGSMYKECLTSMCSALHVFRCLINYRRK